MPPRGSIEFDRGTLHLDHRIDPLDSRSGRPRCDGLLASSVASQQSAEADQAETEGGAIFKRSTLSAKRNQVRAMEAVHKWKEFSKVGIIRGASSAAHGRLHPRPSHAV
jgi:hypothetical protein